MKNPPAMLRVLFGIVPAGMFLVVVLMVLTMVATGRSNERAACYRQALLTQTHCPERAVFDRFMAAVLGGRAIASSL